MLSYSRFSTICEPPPDSLIPLFGIVFLLLLELYLGRQHKAVGLIGVMCLSSDLVPQIGELMKQSIYSNYVKLESFLNEIFL